MKNSYVQAITQLIASGSEVDLVLSRVIAVMEARGHGRLYEEVLKEVVTVLEAKVASSTPKVIVARAEDASTQVVNEALALLDCADVKPTVKIDDTIIGGVVAIKGSEHIDMSYKAALRKLYQAITI
ncbi:MAG: F0F1 ATP synthase subunit delta [Candidatus Paceibacteria bacterium]